MSSQPARQIKHIVGGNIRAARDDLGLTQHTLAARLGMASGHTAVGRWERGVVLPSPATFAKLADVLGCDISWLYTDHNPEKEAA
jgi:transcriptional regulator with XRE-family HTH domain